MVDSLPTEENKANMLREIDLFIKYLNEAKERLTSFPSTNEMKVASQIIERLGNFISLAEQNDSLSKALGSTKHSKLMFNKSLSHQRGDLRIITEELKNLSVDELTERLDNNKTFSVPILKQIAAEYGIRLSSRDSRNMIIQRISKKLSNLRGYELLRKGNTEHF